MPKDYEYRIKATDDASRVVEAGGRKIAASLKNTQSEFDHTASKGKQLAQVLEAMAEEAEAEMRGLEAASERLGAALGDELSGDAKEMASQLRAAGLSFEEIEADAEALASAIRKVDDVAQQAGGGIRRSMGEAADGLDRVRDSGDQSRSVLANMAGNTAQDIGALGGVVGSLGVGIGQLAEYAVDGNIALKNLAAVAGPLALLSVAGLSLNAVMAENAKRIQRAKEVQESYTEALEDTENAQAVTAATAKNFIDSEVIGRVQQLGVNIRNLATAVTDTSIDFDTINGPMRDFLVQTAEGSVSTDELARAMDQFGVASSPLTDELMRLAAAGELDIGTLRDLTRTVGELSTGYAASTDEVARNRAITEALGTTTGATAEQMQAAADAGDRYREALDALNASQDAALGNNISLAEAMLNTADSLDQYAETMQNAEATDREKQQAGLDLISTMQQEAEAAGRSAYDQAVASGNAAGAQAASTRAQIEALWRLAGELAPGSYLRNQITDHINALNHIPRTINTTVRVNASYGQGTEAIPLEGFRASGGPVSAGKAYVVGEDGPELLVPTHSGMVIPNGDGGTPVPAAAVGAGVTFHVGQVNVYPQTLGGSGEDVIDSLEVAVRRGGSNRLRRLVGLT